ncbi:hypothetical protein OZX60_03535 [Streptococcaceae bacterium ESL0687]|nr:hypothetical protein OZX60_03535 [Streptococcaceae bacterium ESL0687]
MKTTYLLLDVDDTLAPLNYRGSDAVEIETWGRGDLAIPRYIVDWLKAFSKKENCEIVWCTDRESETAQIEKQLGFKASDKLIFDNASKGTWKKTSEILRFASSHPTSTVICADNDAWRIPSDLTLPSNLHLIIPNDSKGCLSTEDLNTIDKMVNHKQ